MTKSAKLQLHLDALGAAGEKYRIAINRAERILQARMNERTDRIDVTADELARLYADLEMFDAFEQTGRAAAARKQIAEVEPRHKDNVDGADAVLCMAIQDYLASLGKAAAEATQAFVGAIAGEKDGSQPTGTATPLDHN